MFKWKKKVLKYLSAITFEPILLGVSTMEVDELWEMAPVTMTVVPPFGNGLFPSL